MNVPQDALGASGATQPVHRPGHREAGVDNLGRCSRLYRVLGHIHPNGVRRACHSGGMVRRLGDEELERQLDGLPGWVGETLGIGRSYELPDFPTAIRAVDEIALVAEEMNHHPDIDIRWRRLDIALTTHDAGGVTQLDIELAHRIHEIARQLAARDLDG